jgi:FkbM family methyltransferase
MFSIFDLLPAPLSPIRIVDVGALLLPGMSEPYAPLMQHGAVEITGFEPDVSECNKLNDPLHPERKYLPYAIGDGRRRTFHVTNAPMTSSLYEPNTELLSLFQNIENLTRVVARAEVETKRLDDLPEVNNTDYLKVDVQGAEVDVFSGAANLLREAVMVHTEVQFVPLYRDVPLFSDVDHALRRHGFQFHCFDNVSGRAFKPMIFDNNVNMPRRQMLWADAVYMKDFMALEKLPDEKLLKLAILLHTLYASYDACAFVLRHYQDRTGNKLADSYLRRLASN